MQKRFSFSSRKYFATTIHNTLESGIVVPVRIIVLVGIFAKVNKRTGWNKRTGAN